MAEANVSDKFAQVRGFRVEISGADGVEIDNTWESVAGGVVLLERPHAASPCTAPEITLRGPLTATRHALVNWLDSSARGRKSRRDVTITVVPVDATQPAQTFQFLECFITAYAISPLDAADPRLEPVEEVRFVPGRFPRAR